MSDRYFFDKRVIKRTFGKYAIIFLISFLPLVIFNMLVGRIIKERWLMVTLDTIILLGFVLIGNMIAKRIFEKKDAKLNAKIKEREELKKRKRQILEDSYKIIRENKKKDKNAPEVIEIDDKATKHRRKTK